jgi:uncharacterized protein (DUF2252 family)
MATTRSSPKRAAVQEPPMGSLRRIYSDLAARSRYDFDSPTESWETRHARGRKLRDRIPRRGQAWWKPSADREDVVAQIDRTNSGRVAELLPIRMARMAASRFGFLRGAAAVMAADLARTPSSGIRALIDGDAHVSNFGLFGTIERDVVFDLNDFDEATVGPFEWDLKRLAASIEVAGRDLGYPKKLRRRAVRGAIAGYRQEMLRLERIGALDVWYLFLFAGRKNADPRLDPTTRKVLRSAALRAGERNNTTLLDEIAQRGRDGTWKLRSMPPLQTRVSPSARTRVIDALPLYGESLPRERRYLLGRYHVVDVAQRVVGVGSVGTRDYIVLLFGNDEHDPLFLQVKEATAPGAEPYVAPLPREFRNHPGKRVVMAQRALNGSPDILLGWTRIEGRPYYVRQLRNLKGAVPIDHLGPVTFLDYVGACGAILARAHARCGDAAVIAGYLGGSDVFDRALSRFAERYADQTEHDRETLLKAIRLGRVAAAPGSAP